MRACVVAVVVAVGLVAVPRVADASLIVRGSADDVSTFLAMLQKCTCKTLGLSDDGQTIQLPAEPPIEECPGATPSLRALVNTLLVSDHDVDITVGRNQPGIFVDGFLGGGTGIVDLADLEQIPDRPPPESPNCSTRCQHIAHVFGEYDCAARTGGAWAACHPNPPANTPGTGFGAENAHRTDSGQTTTAVNGVDDPAGGPTFIYTYSDGSVEVWTLDSPGGTTIVSISYP